ncbi:MAG TPA: IS110 family transposase [Candidatus Deferrimicrobiaceae bacterium]|nr:IS110 family transposase [Candidatus Deferrimicrobiaceae bacterium]
MERVLARCCGLDVHKETVAAGLIVPGAAGERTETIRTFGTMTEDLLALRDWLAEHGCTHVAMESTGVFWKPVYSLLEDDFEVLLVNAAHIKNVPGRKTDVSDCAWIAQLLEHGLLHPSFVPPPEIRELRDLTRYRKALILDRTREVNRVHKVLQDAGIKLSSVATDIMGISGRAMLSCLIEGQQDPERLADLAKGKLRSKMGPLRKALRGRFGSHHAFLLAEILSHIDYFDLSIERCSEQITEKLRPFTEAVALLVTIPGVDRKTVETIVAETGADMSRFPSAGHLASWAGMCPGNNESAGKRKSGKTRKGNRWLSIGLTEAALAASRSKDCYLRAQYYRIRTRRGHKKAVRAVAHSILVITYHLLSKRVSYKDLGGDYFIRRDPQVRIRYLVRQLEQMGQRVTVESAA